MDREYAVAWVLAVLVAGFEIAKMLILIGVYDEPWSENLPLHLCRINMFVCAVMLALRSYKFFEVAYFWAIGGSVTAMLTPDLAAGFPHPLYLLFFAGHALAVMSVVYAISGYGFQPRLSSVGVTVVVTLVYMLIVVPINLALDTNYLYLRGKPDGASVLDYLGPWPWYIPALVGVSIVICLVCYAPFALRRKLRPSDAD